MHFPIAEVQAVTAAAYQPQRFDLYGTIHKAMRHIMCELLMEAGRLDVTDAAACQSLCADVSTFADFCCSHIEHENNFVHTALDARLPGASQRIAGEHRQHEEDIAALQARARALAAAAPQERGACAAMLYHSLALFMAHNLAHMYLEEVQHNQQLWAHYRDDELLAIHEALVATVPPAEMAYTMRWMLPAMTPQERVMVLRGVQASAPAPAFEGVMDLAREVLPDAAWRELAREFKREAA